MPDFADISPAALHASPISVRQAGAIVALLLYGAAFFTNFPDSAPAVLRTLDRQATGAVLGLVDRALTFAGSVRGYNEIRSGVYLLVVLGLAPWAVLLVLGRGQPVDFGLRFPNRIGLRAIVVGYVVALPFIVWVARGPAFNEMYAGQAARTGAAIFLGYYLVNLTCEHFFFHGLVLALARRDRRWPSAPPVVESSERRTRRILQWCGLAQPTGEARGLTRWTRWAGLPDGCLPAIVTSAVLFVMVHFGKDVREIFVSAPGGVAMAYLAYRTNTWLVPAALHGLAAGTSYLLLAA